jgi:hypothetical protein
LTSEKLVCQHRPQKRKNLSSLGQLRIIDWQIAKATVFSHFSHPYQRRLSGDTRGDTGGMRGRLGVASRIEESIFARRIGLEPTLTAGSHRVVTG